MVTVERTTDLARVLPIARKAYRRHLKENVFERKVTDQGQIFLVSDHGCFYVHPPRISRNNYGVTLMITKPGSGKWAKEFIEASIDWIFANTDIPELVGISLGLQAEALRLNYTLPGIRAERLNHNDHPQATVRWIVERDAWLNRSK